MHSNAKLSIAYVEYNAHKVRFSSAAISIVNVINVVAYYIPKKKYISIE